MTAGWLWLFMVVVVGIIVFFYFRAILRKIGEVIIKKTFFRKKTSEEKSEKIRLFNSWLDRHNSIFGMVAWVIFSAVVLSPLYYNYPSFTPTVIVKKDGQLEIHKNGNVFCWEWGNNFCVDNNYSESNERNFARGPNIIIAPVALSCSKTSNLAYFLVLEVFNAEKFYKSLNASQKISITKPIFKSTYFYWCIKEVVGYQLYEFNQKNIDNFEKFYNPLENSQQKEFETIVRDSLEKILADKGIKIVSVKFDLKNQQ